MSWIRRHPVIVISVIVSLIAISGTTAWAVNFDQRSSKTLLSDTVVGGVPVGDMHEVQAIGAVRAAIEEPLHRPITVRTESFETQTTAWDLGLQVDVPAAVRKALNRSTEGNIIQRVWRRVVGNPSTSVAVVPTWGAGTVSAVLEQAAQTVDKEPVNAKIDTSTGFVKITPPAEGRKLDLEASRAALVEGAKTGKSSIDLVSNAVQPEVGADAVSKVILVRTGENKLYLYEDGVVTKEYRVATGEAQFPTPTGLWEITSKQVGPTWINPGSDWAKGMPARIGPGPNNPLGSHALALNASGILIHATSDTASIGYSASHGCIRMNTADEIDLFNRVSTGTKVAIVNAGPPVPRGSTPIAVTPDQNAAVNF